MGISSTACASLPAAALTAVAPGWPNGRRGTASAPLQARQPPPAHSSPISSVPATGPAMPAMQSSMVVLTTVDPPTSKLEPPPPPLFPLQNTTRRQPSRVESCIPLSTGVVWAAKPTSNPAPPPTQVVNTTIHHVQLKLAQLAPPTLLTGPHIYKKSLTSRLCPCRVIRLKLAPWAQCAPVRWRLGGGGEGV